MRIRLSIRLKIFLQVFRLFRLNNRGKTSRYCPFSAYSFVFRSGFYKELFHILKGVIAFFAGANLHNILNIINENLSVADMA